MPAAAGRPGLVRYVGLFSGLSGYETEAHIVVDYLRRAGYNLVVVPAGPAARRAGSPRFTDPPVDPSVEVLHLPPLLFELSSDPAWARNAVADTGGRHPRVARTMTETAVLPRSWARACRSLDEIWVPSRFNLTAFARAGLPWHDAVIASLHGRDAEQVMAQTVLPALAAPNAKVALLTDPVFPPQGIARYLLQRGITGKKMMVGDSLSYPEEKFICTDLPGMARAGDRFTNCVVIIVDD